MMENKAYKTVIILVILYVIIMLVIFLPNYIRGLHDKLYILSGDFIKIKYEHNGWHNITNNDDYKLKEFNVYTADGTLGKYRILLTNKYYLYNESGKNVTYEGELFASTGTLKLGVTPKSTLELEDSDKEIIKNALEKIKITEYDNFNISQKYVLDVDNDGIDEKIYCLSNYFMESNFDKLFSVVFIEKNGEINILIKKVIDKDKIYDEPSYEINRIVDIKEDKKYEIIIEQNYFSRPQESCAIIYNLYENKKEIANLCK